MIFWAMIWGIKSSKRSIAGTPVFVDGEALQVTTSVGVAEVESGETLRDVFKRADDALYKAKQAGRNRALPAEIRKAA